MSNVINTIFPYKKSGQWMFDDPRVGLKEEAFVAGADTFLDSWCDAINISEAVRKRGVKVLFSMVGFPGSIMLKKVGGGPKVGTDYIAHVDERRPKMWLCPALNLYYPKSPTKLYVQVSKR